MTSLQHKIISNEETGNVRRTYRKMKDGQIQTEACLREWREYRSLSSWKATKKRDNRRVKELKVEKKNRLTAVHWLTSVMKTQSNKGNLLTDTTQGPNTQTGTSEEPVRQTEGRTVCLNPQVMWHQCNPQNTHFQNEKNIKTQINTTIKKTTKQTYKQISY